MFIVDLETFSIIILLQFPDKTRDKSLVKDKHWLARNINLEINNLQHDIPQHSAPWQRH